jgi:hypothetical protein
MSSLHAGHETRPWLIVGSSVRCLGMTATTKIPNTPVMRQITAQSPALRPFLSPISAPTIAQITQTTMTAAMIQQSSVFDEYSGRWVTLFLPLYCGAPGVVSRMIDLAQRALSCNPVCWTE